MRPRGLGLLEVVIATTLLGVVTVGTMSYMRSAFKGQRTLASGSDALSYGDATQQILRHPDTCGRSGLAGRRLDPSNPETGSDPIALHWPTPSGPGDVFLAEGRDLDSTWRVTKLRFLSLVPLGGGGLYFGRLQYVIEDLKGSRGGAPKKVKDLLVNVQLDGTNHITGCYGEAPTVLGCVSFSASPNGAVIVTESNNVPPHVDPMSAATGEPFAGGESTWGAYCNPGWIRTGCGAAELANPGTYGADSWIMHNGCQSDDEEISGANPRVFLICCRNF